jgi:hypothetical protein
MASFHLAAGETVSIQAAAKVRDGDGTVFVSNQRIGWCPSGSQAPQISVAFTDVKGIFKSREGKPPPQLRFTTEGTADDAKALGFTLIFFDSPTGISARDLIYKQLRSCVDGVNAQSAAATAASNEAAVVAGPGTLRDIYAELVSAGVMTAAEAEQALTTEARRGDMSFLVPQQRTGLSSELVGPIEKRSAGGKPQFVFPEYVIQQILYEDPVARRARELFVPSKVLIVCSFCFFSVGLVPTLAADVGGRVLGPVPRIALLQ